MARRKAASDQPPIPVSLSAQTVIVLVLLAANFAADTGAVELRHDPIEQREARPVGFAELANGGAAIFDGDDFVSGAFESLFEKAARERLVIGDENFQLCTSAM